MPLIYHIAPFYRKVTIWRGNQHCQRLSVSTCTPNKGLTLEERQAVIKKKLEEESLQAPLFITTK